MATNFRYAGWGQVDSVWGGQGPAQRLFIGAPGRVDSTRVGGSAYRSRFTYDSRGRLVQALDPMGHLSIKHWYDGANGNLVVDSVPGRRVTYGADAYGRQIGRASCRERV